MGRRQADGQVALIACTPPGSSRLCRIEVGGAGATSPDSRKGPVLAMLRTSLDFLLVALVAGVAIAIWAINVVQLVSLVG